MHRPGRGIQVVPRVPQSPGAAPQIPSISPSFYSISLCEKERQRERERDRKRHGERKTERERERDRKRHRERDRKREREREREREGWVRQTAWQVCREAEKLMRQKKDPTQRPNQFNSHQITLITLIQAFPETDKGLLIFSIFPPPSSSSPRPRPHPPQPSLNVITLLKPSLGAPSHLMTSTFHLY